MRLLGLSKQLSAHYLIYKKTIIYFPQCFFTVAHIEKLTYIDKKEFSMLEFIQL